MGGLGCVNIYEVATNLLLHTQRHVRPVTAAKFAPRGRIFAVTTSGVVKSTSGRVYGGALMLYDTAMFVRLQKISFPSFLVACAFSSEGKHVAVGCADGTTVLYEVDLALARWRVLGLQVHQRE